MTAKKKKIGLILISIGIVSLIAAVVYTLYNVYDDVRAGKEMKEINIKLEEILFSETTGVITEAPAETTEPSESAENVEITYDDEQTAADEETSARVIPEMPVVSIDGADYIALLKIPSLELEFSVQKECSPAALKKSPCRYEGSVYTDDLIICAHNYKTFFRRLKEIEAGAEVYLIDMNGNVYTYSVDFIETIDKYDIATMTTSGYDLTLFTCTTGGRARVTVRCSMKNTAVY